MAAKWLSSAFFLCVSLAGQAPPLKVSTPVELRGRIQKRFEYGPPGYGEDKKNDSKEFIYVLLLDHSINVSGDPSDSLNSSDISDVREIQLSAKGWGRVERVRGQVVNCFGTLFEAFSGHHYTKVLMDVQRIALVKGVPGKEPGVPSSTKPPARDPDSSGH